MHPHRLGITFGPQFPTAVLEVADKLFLLGVHRDRWLLLGLERLDLSVDVLELGVTVRMVAPLTGLAVGLQAEAELVQQPTDQLVADLKAASAPELLPNDAGSCSPTASPPPGRRGSPSPPGPANLTSGRDATSSPACVRRRGGAPAHAGRPAAVWPIPSRPRPIVLRATPVATDVAAIPPWPAVFASLAATSRRARSSRNGDSATNRDRIAATSITGRCYRSNRPRRISRQGSILANFRPCRFFHDPIRLFRPRS